MGKASGASTTSNPITGSVAPKATTVPVSTSPDNNQTWMTQLGLSPTARPANYVHIPGGPVTMPAPPAPSYDGLDPSNPNSVAGSGQFAGMSLGDMRNVMQAGGTDQASQIQSYLEGTGMSPGQIGVSDNNHPNGVYPGPYNPNYGQQGNPFALFTMLQNMGLFGAGGFNPTSGMGVFNGVPAQPEMPAQPATMDPLMLSMLRRGSGLGSAGSGFPFLGSSFPTLDPTYSSVPYPGYTGPFF